MEEITIILTNRNTLEFLQLAIESIRKNQYTEHELIIMDDNSTDGSKEWLKNNRHKYNFSYHTHDDPERHGIVGMVDEGIVKATKPLVFIGHSDMYYAKDWEKNLVKHIKPKTIVCSTRIEPPIHPPEPCKLLQAFGTFPEEFKEPEFVEFVEQRKKERKDTITNGIFAPILAYKNEWIGHDKLFYPQSQEDSDLWYRMQQQGFRFIQSWDSYVYHFTSRGSRFNNETKKSLKDSTEWQLTNKKNLKNFIRRYGTTPLYNNTKNPFIVPKISISAHVLACDRDSSYVYGFLDKIEPYFDEIIFVVDSDKTSSKVEDEINKYITAVESIKPNNFDPKKIKVFYRQLNNDFAAQTNYAVDQCTNEWTMKIDLDESFSDDFLNYLTLTLHAAGPQITVIGFPRINILNKVAVNDIPRSEWTTEKLAKHPTLNAMQGRMNVNNPDMQFRLHKKSVQWHGQVHEVPLPVAQRNKEAVTVSDKYFLHEKTIDRQNTQNQMYNNITGKKPITKHAREEVKKLSSFGYDVQLLDWYRYNPMIEDCEFFKKFYTPINIHDNDYAVVCNQPPERWNKTLGLKNFIGYLAFEGHLPPEWTRLINRPEVRELWTPSEYCKKLFAESGVQVPIHVIPHGIDPTIWKPLEIKKDKNEPFTFLWVGTNHNTRKGYDLAVKAFTETFKPEDNVRLILKANKIYDSSLDFNKQISKFADPTGNKNIYIIDEEMTEKDMVELFNKVDAFVSPHRSEGFGLNILQALACGTPVIATKATGNMDFCNVDNTYFIGVEPRDKWAPFIYPYLVSKWPEPSLDGLKIQMKNMISNYDSRKEHALKESEKIRREWTWENVAKKIDERLKQL